MNLPYGTYSIEQNGNIYYGPSCGNSIGVTTSGASPVSSGNDFADTLSPIIDVQAIINGWAVRPVIPFDFYLYVDRTGLSQADVLTYYVPAPGFVISNTTPAFDYVNGDTLFWDFQSMSTSTVIHIEGNAPNANIGDTVEYCYGAWPNIMDIDSTNNEHCAEMIVTGSYDPNEKHVMPKGNGPNGEIYLQDSLLTYTVLFQNTGTDTAFTVVIMDTLSSKLDPSTFQYIGASHNCIPELLPGNVLKFTFNNILLPDSTTNEPKSHGFVHFKIEADPTVQVGDVIENTAGIYFDYNEPIITNTTVNTYVDPPVGNGVRELSSVDVLIYPNPNNGTFTIINGGQQRLNMTLYTVDGKQVHSAQLVDGVNRFNLQNELSTGMYIYTLNDGQKVVDRGRIIIE